MKAIKRMETSIGWFSRVAGVLLGLALALAANLRADEVAPADTGKTNSDMLATYKKMSLQELMDQEVTSVAKQP